jgi:hypothetical protein
MLPDIFNSSDMSVFTIIGTGIYSHCIPEPCLRLQAADELPTIAQELALLRHAASIPEDERSMQSAGGPPPPDALMRQLREALHGLSQREQLRGAVFGPSHALPTMTIEQVAQGPGSRIGGEGGWRAKAREGRGAYCRRLRCMGCRAVVVCAPSPCLQTPLHFQS